MSLDVKACPQCGSTVAIGFGLAGGGYGPYLSCNDDKEIDCQWFYKEQEEL